MRQFGGNFHMTPMDMQSSNQCMGQHLVQNEVALPRWHDSTAPICLQPFFLSLGSENKAPCSSFASNNDHQNQNFPTQLSIWVVGTCPRKTSVCSLKSFIWKMFFSRETRPPCQCLNSGILLFKTRTGI